MTDRAKLLEDMAAYLLDRADQYETSDWRWNPLADAAHAIMQGEFEASLSHGELDDPELRRRVRKWRAAPPQESGTDAGTSPSHIHPAEQTEKCEWCGGMGLWARPLPADPWFGPPMNCDECRGTGRVPIRSALREGQEGMEQKSDPSPGASPVSAPTKEPTR